MKKVLIVLMALLCIAPVFAKKSIGLEVGGNVGYSYKQAFCNLMPDTASYIQINNSEGLELGANAKYALNDKISVYAKADVVLAIYGWFQVDDGGELRDSGDYSNDGSESFTGFDIAAGAAYNLELKKSDFGFAFGVGVNYGGVVLSYEYGEASIKMAQTALGLDILAEANYKVSKNLVAFVDIEPNLVICSFAGSFYRDRSDGSSTTESGPSFAHIGLGFSASAGVRYAF